MRTILIFLFAINYSLGFSKTTTKWQINKYLSVEKTGQDFVFVSNEGKKSKVYRNAYFAYKNFILAVRLSSSEADSIMKVDKNIAKVEPGYNEKEIRYLKYYHLFKIMTDLNVFDSYYFNDRDSFDSKELYNTFSEFSYEAIRDKFEFELNDNGYATKNKKCALINKKGEILTDFKYNFNYFKYNPDTQQKTLNQYTDNGKLIWVILDNFTGKELVRTKDSIIKYWAPQNYLVKNIKNEYYLTYKSEKYKVPNVFRNVKNLPFESSIFTSFNGQKNVFFNLNGVKVITKFIPYTNFYKGHCIAYFHSGTERNTFGFIEDKYDVKIINEEFEIVKSFDGPAYERLSFDSDVFNKYGQIIMRYNDGYSVVIDYKGNQILPEPLPILPTKSQLSYDNRIKEVFEGLYRVEDYPTYNRFDLNVYKNQSNYYNQMGIKLIPNDLIGQVFYLNNYGFIETKDVNYLMFDSRASYLTLDKENYIISN